MTTSAALATTREALLNGPAFEVSEERFLTAEERQLVSNSNVKLADLRAELKKRDETLRAITGTLETFSESVWTYVEELLKRADSTLSKRLSRSGAFQQREWWLGFSILWTMLVLVAIVYSRWAVQLSAIVSEILLIWVTYRDWPWITRLEILIESHKSQLQLLYRGSDGATLLLSGSCLEPAQGVGVQNALAAGETAVAVGYSIKGDWVLITDVLRQSNILAKPSSELEIRHVKTLEEAILAIVASCSESRKLLTDFEAAASLEQRIEELSTKIIRLASVAQERSRTAKKREDAEKQRKVELERQSQIEEQQRREAELFEAERDKLEKAWSKVAVCEELRDYLTRRIERFAQSGTPGQDGLLLYGLPGTGKTLIGRALSEIAGCQFLSVKLPDLKRGIIGESGKQVRELWEKARASGKAIIFIDECDAVFASRGGTSGDTVVNEIVSAFLAEWDGIEQTSSKVFVIGATNRQEIIDGAIMSRFGVRKEVVLPDKEMRSRILTAELNLAGFSFLQVPETIVKQTPGMSGRDLQKFIQEVATESHPHAPKTEDFYKVLDVFRKQRSTGVDPEATWESLIIPTDLKNRLQTYCEIFRNFESLRSRGVPLPKGLLLYGPPGTGKTQVARTMSKESGLGFIGCSTADLKQGWVGHSGIKVKEIFQQARSQAPAILFIDELDIVAPPRGTYYDTITSEIVGQLLQEMDGIRPEQNAVFVIGATNRKGSVDAAVLSRFAQEIEIGLPDDSARREMLLCFIGEQPFAGDRWLLVERLGALTNGYSGRRLKTLVGSAVLSALYRSSQLGKPDQFILLDSDFDEALRLSKESEA